MAAMLVPYCDGKKAANHERYNVGAHFEKISWGVAGPLPTPTSNNIHVSMDYFSKLLEACAIPNQQASTMAEVVVVIWYADMECHWSYIQTKG